MRCTCGRELSDKAKFCPSCGKPVERAKKDAGYGMPQGAPADALICGRCGAKVKPTAKFCGKCGTKLSPENIGRAAGSASVTMPPEVPATALSGSPEDEWFSEMPPL